MIQEEVHEKVGRTGIKLTLGSSLQISFRYSLGTDQLTEEETEAQESHSEISEETFKHLVALSFCTAILSMKLADLFLSLP